MPRTSQGKYVTEASKIFQEGDVNWHAGEYDQAKANYSKAAKSYHDSDDAEGEAFALTRLGELQLSLEEYEDAYKSLQSAAELVKNEDYAQNTYGDIILKLSKVETARGQLEQALKLIDEAHKVLAGIGNRDLQGEVYDHEAYVYLMQNREAEALKAYAKAAQLFADEGISLKEASTLRAIARIEMKNKNYDRAHDLLEHCRNLYRENGDLLGEASALSAIGCLRYIIRDIEKARKALMKSVYLYGRVSHHFAEAESLLYLARVEAFDNIRGDFDRAKSHYKRSIELFDFLGNDIMKKVVLDEYHDFLNRIG